NDADPCIYALWRSILTDPSRFIAKVRKAKLSIPAWKRHRRIYRSPRGRSLLTLGFSTFYLNRCNRSGIIARGGPIGGHQQTGKWGLDARFNREALIERIEKIYEYRSRIVATNLDALEFIRRIPTTEAERHFVY